MFLECLLYTVHLLQGKRNGGNKNYFLLSMADFGSAYHWWVVLYLTTTNKKNPSKTLKNSKSNLGLFKTGTNPSLFSVPILQVKFCLCFCLHCVLDWHDLLTLVPTWNIRRIKLIISICQTMGNCHAVTPRTKTNQVRLCYYLIPEGCHFIQFKPCSC